MHDDRKPAATGPRPNPQALLRLLREDDLDAAIDAGLMDYRPSADDGMSDADRQRLEAARLRLQSAWDARERHRARRTRLARRKAEHEARHQPPAAATTSEPALPASAASALARALARASGKSTP